MTLKGEPEYLGRLLIAESPLQVLPTLARRVGLNQAVILQQMHYWLQTSKHERNGEKWLYNSYAQWARQFPWLSVRAVQKHILALEKMGFIISDNFNEKKVDQTKWYRLNYAKLVDQCEKSNSGGGEESNSGRARNSQSVPESTQETPPPPPQERVPRLSNNSGVAAMQKYLGYPEKTGKDPVPNPGMEAKYIKKMMDRGYDWPTIACLWQDKVDRRGEFVSMRWVNEDIGKGAGNGAHRTDTAEADARLQASIGAPIGDQH